MPDEVGGLRRLGRRLRLPEPGRRASSAPVEQVYRLGVDPVELPGDVLRLQRGALPAHEDAVPRRPANLRGAQVPHQVHLCAADQGLRSRRPRLLARRRCPPGLLLTEVHHGLPRAHRPERYHGSLHPGQPSPLPQLVDRAVRAREGALLRLCAGLCLVGVGRGYHSVAASTSTIWQLARRRRAQRRRLGGSRRRCVIPRRLEAVAARPRALQREGLEVQQARLVRELPRRVGLGRRASVARRARGRPLGAVPVLLVAGLQLGDVVVPLGGRLARGRLGRDEAA
mmetsp:Transcript_14783/g.44416  ORF Transcript_14783/g.44416 Transcript_14783/m.44416 type:complete len:284 (-) Transcript_14783:573-1424(-)